MTTTSPGVPDPTTTVPSALLPSPTTPTTPAPPTTAPAAGPARTLVVVQLNGGNDALNTLVPASGDYRDARPTLAIPERDLVELDGVEDWALHPSLAPLVDPWRAGHAAFLPGIGFPHPDRSHFVSLDRWWRADDLTAGTGWLGRALAGAATSAEEAVGRPAPLYATALGAGAPVLRSDLFQPAVVLRPAGFQFPTAVPGAVLARLATPAGDDPIVALAQRSLTDTIAAVASFSDLLASTTSVEPDDVAAGADIDQRDLRSSLALAARLVTADIGVRIVVVSVGGFDTHSRQSTTHAGLLADLAAGITTFMSTVTAAGAAERTMLVTTSEFGRRVAENASGGSDHGAGGLSMMFGPMVAGGVRTTVDLDDQLDGDIRPSVDPRTMYTACLDWLGMDAVSVLGSRYDEVALLRPGALVR